MGQAARTDSDRRLDSWKEIAAFFGRDERTVRRWEKENVLPVHRVPGGAKGRVFAYESELRQWLGTPQAAADTATSVLDLPTRGPGAGGETPSDVNSKLWQAGKWVAAFALCGLLLAGVVIYRKEHRFAASASAPRPSPAEEFYLKGRYYWERRTPDDLNKAIDYFTQAIVKDPNYAQAYVGLADSYNLVREFGAMPNSEAYPRAIAAAQRAIQLDDNSAEAHLSLAFGTYWWLWHGVSAEREFKRALALKPNLVRAHHWYATYLLGVGRWSEALDQIEQARRLDPSSDALLADKGQLLACTDHLKEGRALLEQLEQTDPSLSSTHAYLSAIYFDRKEYDKWLVEARKVAELRHDKAALAQYDSLDKALASGGIHAVYEAQLPLQKEQVEHGTGSAYYLAFLYAQLGKKEEADKSLELAFDRRDNNMLIGDRPIPGLENDATFTKLREQVKQMLAQ